MLDGLRSFDGVGVRPRFVVLDDGWQHTDTDNRTNGQQWGGRLQSFRANFKFHPKYNASLSQFFNAVNAHNSKNVEIGVEIESTTVFQQSGTHSDQDSITVASDTSSLSFDREHTLREVVRAAKSDHGVSHFLVWHSLLGYWAGVEPATSNSELSSDEADSLLDTATAPPSLSTGSRHNSTPSKEHNAISELSSFRSRVTYPYLPTSMHRMSQANALTAEPFSTAGVGLVDRAEAARFYESYHRSLRDMGVDGVKVDAQSIVSSLSDERGGGWELALDFHRGLKQAVGSHFGDGGREHPVVHCMGHSQGTMWAVAALYPNINDYDELSDGSQNVLDKEDKYVDLLRQPVFRGSDDFWPQVHNNRTSSHAQLFECLSLYLWMHSFAYSLS